MILQALAAYYEKLAEMGKATRPGWCTAKVSYALNLTEKGELQGIIYRKKKEERGKKTVEVAVPITVPEMTTRSSGVSANFLCDNAKYMLGIDKENDEKSRKRAQECFEAAREKHLSILKNAQGKMAMAVKRFFENWNPEKALENPIIRDRLEELTDGGNLIFCMGIQEEAQKDEEIKSIWEKSYLEAESGDQGICLVTGKKGEIARIHRVIKGVPGAQSSGAALVSFNAPAFESYEKSQSYNAPVSKEAEFAYTTALNFLLSDREYSMQIGDTMVVFWAESGRNECRKVFWLSANPPKDNQKEIASLFEDIKEHKYINYDEEILDPKQKFYILGIAPNAARLSVRFFYQDSFGNILNNFSLHYQRMNMIKPSWEQREFLGIWSMLYETVNQKSKDKTPVPNMAAMVLRSIVSGGQYPQSLYLDTLMRIRAEQGEVNWGRASIIKAFLIQNYKWKEGEEYMALNEESKDTAYVLGRLFFALEAVQMEANPDIKATIRDRYFNSACTAPASVFPVLFRLKNSHMKKIERDKGSSKKYYEYLFTDITGKLDDIEFPAQLTLKEQGKFILGYYHQKQKKYEKREEK